MTNFDNLIQYEIENTSLDFKGTQYHKETYDSFIKDIMAMANADGENDKHIIIGVVWDDNGERQLRGIKKEDFIDSATFQQIIRENIEPDIYLEYFLHEFENKNFPIFKLSNCSEKPYMMKKQYKNLGKGDSWIRKGTHQDRMIRRDFEIIFNAKYENRGFEGQISLDFLDSGKPELEIKATCDFRLPSQTAKKEIQEAISKKENSNPPQQPYDRPPFFEAFKIAQGFQNPFYRSYDDMTIDELKKTLGEVEKKYREHDLYAVFEERTTKIKLKITNHGDEYIEDGSIELTFPKKEGLLISPKVFNKPVPITDFTTLAYQTPTFFYPNVKEIDETIIVKAQVGEIKHNTYTIVFSEPLRIKVAQKLIGDSISIQCKIIGKNIKKPIMKVLKLYII